MENVFLTSLTTPEVRQMFRDELIKFFDGFTIKSTSDPEDSESLTIKQLAEYLNCSKATVHAYKKRGVFPFYQAGRTVYFKKSEVDQALGSKQKRR